MSGHLNMSIDSGRETSEDPSDVISPPKSSIPLPSSASASSSPQSRSHSRQTITNSTSKSDKAVPSRSRSRIDSVLIPRRSSTCSRSTSMSRSTSPAKRKNEKGRGAKSTSPEKQTRKLVLASGTVSETSHGDGEDQGDGLASGVRRKKRRIHSGVEELDVEVEKGLDHDNAEALGEQDRSKVLSEEASSSVHDGEEFSRPTNDQTIPEEDRSQVIVDHTSAEMIQTTAPGGHDGTDGKEDLNQKVIQEIGEDPPDISVQVNDEDTLIEKATLNQNEAQCPSDEFSLPTTIEKDLPMEDATVASPGSESIQPNILPSATVGPINAAANSTELPVESTTSLEGVNKMQDEDEPISPAQVSAKDEIVVERQPASKDQTHPIAHIEGQPVTPPLFPIGVSTEEDTKESISSQDNAGRPTETEIDRMNNFGDAAVSADQAEIVTDHHASDAPTEERINIDEHFIVESKDTVKNANEEEEREGGESEGEMELDPSMHYELPLPHEDEQSSVDTGQTPTATPAPSSPTKSISSTSKPTKKPAPANKKKGPAGNTKKTSTPTSSSNLPKKGGKGKGKTKVEELKADSKARSTTIFDGASSSPQTPSRSTSYMNSPNPSPDKNAVYCVCRKPYNEEDDEVLMVGCESCDNWFHPPCVGLSESMVEALDVYICKSCERSTHQRTIYKQLCKREGCTKSVAGTSSKFCSPSCAYQHSQSLLSSLTNKNTLKQLAKTFVSYPAPELGVHVTQHRETPIPTTKNPRQVNEDRLMQLEAQMEEVEKAMTVLRKRQDILKLAVEKCEDLPSITAVVEEEEVEQKKGKRKKGSGAGGGAGGSKDDRPCGWDKLLILDDGELTRLAGVQQEEEGRLCMRGRRRCDRHQGWQKTIAAQLKGEQTSLERMQKRLNGFIEDLKSSIEIKSFSDDIRNGFLEKKGTLKG
ncbi:uncharacterized protein IL334_005540 [Kwoniella shivajii]|uniref:PHD-type domain-containing protein n=1 Tax=Kwoniella shivajii TaxID=564305 RepID=A0ABZ1D432_9TREE|nr:hypothetical protein IL334_005540 [Kwoniella shivajii]